MSKPRVIEKVKDVVLVVLFLSTILLLYFFWSDMSFDEISLPSYEGATLETPALQDIMRPSQISVNFGGENYTIVSSGNKDVWYNDKSDQESILGELNRFGQTENILLEEITPEKYEESMTYPSIWAEFDYHIPFVEFCKKYNINAPQSYNGIAYLTGLGYSEASSQSLLVYDGLNEKFYRLATDKDYTNFSKLIDSLELNYKPYYPISAYSAVANSTLIPLSIQGNLKSLPYKQESYPHQSDKINNMAEKFFGENFDFVRTIKEENGTQIYMYGYGDKVLIANTNGSFEYRDRQPNQKSSSQGYFEALETALQFVTSHGSWHSLEGSEMTPYLKDVIINPRGERGYRFIFGMEVNGARLHYDNTEILVVDVILGQVTNYYRNMIDLDQEELKNVETSPPEGGYSAVNLLAQNYRHIHNIMADNVEEITKGIADAKAFEEVALNIEKMETGYLRTTSEEGNHEIQPAWVVTARDMDIYFNLHSGEPMGYTVKNQ